MGEVHDRWMQEFWTRSILERPWPPGGTVEEVRLDGAHLVHPRTKASIIFSVNKEQDDRYWLRVSLAHPGRMPTYEELAGMKAWLIGTDRYAYQVFPPLKKHVNIHPTVLHLWSCLSDSADGQVLPDFTRGGNSI